MLFGELPMCHELIDLKKKSNQIINQCSPDTQVDLLVELINSKY